MQSYKRSITSKRMVLFERLTSVSSIQTLKISRIRTFAVQVPPQLLTHEVYLAWLVISEEDVYIARIQHHLILGHFSSFNSCHALNEESSGIRTKRPNVNLQSGDGHFLTIASTGRILPQEEWRLVFQEDMNQLGAANSMNDATEYQAGTLVSFVL